MIAVAQIPKILVYEEIEGNPIYRKGYRDFLLGLKTIEEINMGTSTLQWFINNVIQKYLIKTLPDNFIVGSGELGLHLGRGTNFAADIAIYREGQLKVGFHSNKYSDTPPSVVIEIDIKIDESEYFQNEEEYFHRKTEQLLQWGVERVLWIFSSSRRVLVADNLKKWSFDSWDLPIKVIDDYEINVWDLMLKGGFVIE